MLPAVRNLMHSRSQHGDSWIKTGRSKFKYRYFEVIKTNQNLLAFCTIRSQSNNHQCADGMNATNPNPYRSPSGLAFLIALPTYKRRDPKSRTMIRISLAWYLSTINFISQTDTAKSITDMRFLKNLFH